MAKLQIILEFAHKRSGFVYNLDGESSYKRKKRAVEKLSF